MDWPRTAGRVSGSDRIHAQRGTYEKVRGNSRLPRCCHDSRGLWSGKIGAVNVPGRYTAFLCVFESSIQRINRAAAVKAEFPVKCRYSGRDLRGGIP